MKRADEQDWVVWADLIYVYLQHDKRGREDRREDKHYAEESPLGRIVFGFDGGRAFAGKARHGLAQEIWWRRACWVYQGLLLFMSSNLTEMWVQLFDLRPTHLLSFRQRITCTIQVPSVSSAIIIIFRTHQVQLISLRHAPQVESFIGQGSLASTQTTDPKP